MATATNTPVLADYREQKKKLDRLAADARKQLQARYSELLAEAASIQAEFKENFGVNPELPGAVKAFAIVPKGEKKAATATEAMTQGKKIGGLRRSLNAAIKNGDTARAVELASQLKDLGAPVELDDDGKGFSEGTPAEAAADPSEEGPAGPVDEESSAGGPDWV